MCLLKDQNPGFLITYPSGDTVSIMPITIPYHTKYNSYSAIMSLRYHQMTTLLHCRRAHSTIRNESPMYGIVNQRNTTPRESGTADPTELPFGMFICPWDFKKFHKVLRASPIGKMPTKGRQIQVVYYVQAYRPRPARVPVTILLELVYRSERSRWGNFPALRRRGQIRRTPRFLSPFCGVSSLRIHNFEGQVPKRGTFSP